MPPVTILLEELRGAQAACFELFFKTPGLEICPPVYEVKIFLGHCRCRQGIVCVRPKDSKNPSKLEWDGGGAHWEHCQLWWRRPNLTTGHLVAPTRVSLPIVNQLFTTFDPQADCDSPWFNPFQAWGKDAIVTPGILFRTTEEPPKIILCKFIL